MTRITAYRRCIVEALILATALLAYGSPEVKAYDFENPYELFSPEARAIIESAETQSCDEDWQLFWGLLRDGEPAAGVHLAMYMQYGGLVPPGSSPDRLSFARHFKILLAYAVPSLDPVAVDFVKASADYFGVEFPSCVAQGWRTKQECLDRAIADGALPSIEVYDREIAALSEARKLPARCIKEAILDPHMMGQLAHPYGEAPPPRRPPCQNFWCLP